MSAAHRLDATTVGDLLGLGSKQLFNLPGLGAKTRQELQRRIREWRSRLGEQETSPLQPGKRQVAETEVSAAGASDPGAGEPHAELDRVGLDTIAALLVPVLLKNGRNATEVDATRLLLGLPDESGALPDQPPWPQQPLVAKVLDVTTGRVAQVLIKQRKRWRDEPVVRSLHAEVVELLAASGRVMGVPELAAALLMRRGSTRTGARLRTAIATAAVRAAVEIDSLADEPRLLTRRHGTGYGGAVGQRRGRAEDAGRGPRCWTMPMRSAGSPTGWPHRRCCPPRQPCCGSCPRCACRRWTRVEGWRSGGGYSSRPRPRRTLRPPLGWRSTPGTWTPVRALRLAQAGVVPPAVGDKTGPAGLKPEQVHERVRARFPELAPLPAHPALDRLLREAGFEVQWRDGAYVSPCSGLSWSDTAVTSRRATRSGGSRWTAATPEEAAAVRAEQQLADAGAGDGFRALTVRISRFTRARQELIHRFGVEPRSVAELFLSALHELVDARPKPTWETILGADAAEPGQPVEYQAGRVRGERLDPAAAPTPGRGRRRRHSPARA